MTEDPTADTASTADTPGYVDPADCVWDVKEVDPFADEDPAGPEMRRWTAVTVDLEIFAAGPWRMDITERDATAHRIEFGRDYTSTSFAGDSVVVADNSRGEGIRWVIRPTAADPRG